MVWSAIVDVMGNGTAMLDRCRSLVLSEMGWGIGAALDSTIGA